MTAVEARTCSREMRNKLKVRNQGLEAPLETKKVLEKFITMQSIFDGHKKPVDVDLGSWSTIMIRLRVS